MHLYRKVVPKIARDIVRTLSNSKQIEVEEGKLDEAELDLAAVMVEYLNAEDRIVKEAQDSLHRRNLGQERFPQLKKSIAEARGVKIGEEGIEYVIQQLVEALFASKNVAEVFAEDFELRKVINETMAKYLAISEELDKEARARIKNLREGTPEWDIEYPRIVAQIKRQKGLA
jgi:hypothetical protein